ncbi:MAG: long-chain fatty acid--CoA ligase [bacterium]
MASLVHDRPWIRLCPRQYEPELEPQARSQLEHLRQALEHGGGKPAIHYFNGTLSYRDLEEMSDAFACALLEGGLKKGDRVAFYLQNVPQFVIAQLGVWKAGGIVVPLNPMYKERELQYYFKDSGARVLICLESLYRDVACKAAKGSGLQRIITTSELDFLDSASPVPEALKSAVKGLGLATEDFLHLLEKHSGQKPPEVSLEPHEVAYLTYTSGTTGPPKGAMNSHGNVVFNSEVYCRCWELGPSDVLLGVAPLFHVTGMVAHIGAALCSGIPLVLFHRFDTSTAWEMVEKWRVSLIMGSITVFIALMNDQAVGSRDISSFRKAFSGGAPVSPAIVERFESLTGCYIHNVYGLTESTSPTHLVPLGLRAPVDPSTGALSIGLPIPGHLAKIVDLEDRSQELPPGQVGELAVKGPGIVSGYWNKPEETAHAIQEGWLFTGDVGTMDEEGWFYILDRKKDMIIASGFKVWPREVEDVLYLHPGVKEAAVVGVPDPYRGETVKAFVALRDQFKGRLSPEELIEFCKERMAAYKYPRCVEFVEEVPKTPTGKFLRRALREMPQERGNP